MTTIEFTASETLTALEWRLQRIDYALHGSSDRHLTSTARQRSEGQTVPAATRLHNLERQLHDLTTQSRPANDILHLNAKHPSLLTPSASPTGPAISPSSLAQLLIAHKAIYTRLASQLPTLQSDNNYTGILDSDAFAKLISLETRIKAAVQRQEVQGAQFTELRARSADLVRWWYQKGVLGMGELWAEWEERMKEVEIMVRQIEGNKRRDEDFV